MSIEGGEGGGFRSSAHYDIDRLKGGTLEPLIIGRPILEGGPDLKGGTSNPSSYHGSAYASGILKLFCCGSKRDTREGCYMPN